MRVKTAGQAYSKYQYDHAVKKLINAKPIIQISNEIIYISPIAVVFNTAFIND